MENKFISENYMEIIIPNRLVDTLEIGTSVTYVNSKHSIANIPRDQIDFCTLGTFNYSNFPSIFTLDSSLALEQIGVTRLQANPNFSLYGTGVLIGIIDSGINYQNPAFLYSDKSTRIYTIWDQTITDENAPVNEDFPYGTIYSKVDINRALKSPTPLEIVPTNDEIGHGTAIAGIAAGSTDTSNDFAGAAPLSELVVVKMKQAKNITKQFFSIREDAICYQETDVMLGIKFLESIASELNRPLVLCIAFGTGQGPHDSLGSTSTYLANITSLPKTCVVISAGNEGNSQRHYSYNIRSGVPFDEFEMVVGENDKKFFMEIWLEPIQRISLEITSPSGETISNTNPAIRHSRRYSFVFSPTVICINNIATVSETGLQLVWLRFENAQSGPWRFRYNNIDNTSSVINVWLPSGDIISTSTYFLQADPETTVTSPGDAVAPVTIGSYNTLEGGISYFSGIGYTRKGEVKPDLAAPGTDIKAPSGNTGYSAATGTGAAAALTSGAVALLLEWAVVRGNYTIITGREVKTLLIRGARRETSEEYPNRFWGYGKVDIYGVFEKLII
ncbi:S8 family peptidase [Lachnoclostridium phytofermentans]|uniref:Peptidase S8 and S53 subtilisin kexin sedolisin n=1 Tax=Lachnoclostridium phytofermentans (strain ATCC 700394 / DSM 18823 / ISDg) TaxID=357809 RepID=A9KQN3_LACP7|nr:S8 family peptidase [Lachnoclostridium phytofermentans]ABX41946.1 peptidase S8 and S53 subtilisin kexin sedolisin [Lachnoclostridium phytofermentans ISDg]